MTIVEIVPIANLVAFAGHFAAAATALALFIWIYTAITPYREMALIRKGDIAAALSLGGAVIGFSLPVAAVVNSSTMVVETAVWSVIALAVQLAVYGVVRMLIRDIAAQIVDNHIAAGLFLGTLSIAVGVINAAAMCG